MRVCIINTGGTIGCVGEPLAPMPAGEFAAAVQHLLGSALGAALPGLSLHFDAGLGFDSPTGTLDSTDLRPTDWCRMTRRLLDLYAGFDAFVILHGTDTMDFTAAALPFLLNVFDPLGLGRALLSKPVILTGAQLPLLRQTPEGLVLNAGSDAFANLAGALACARLCLPEVAVFFDGRLLRGNRALKVSTMRFAGFDSPHLPPLAEAGIGVWHGPAAPLAGPAAPERSLDDPAARDLALAQLDAVEAALEAHPVLQLPVGPADHRRDLPLLADMIDAALASGIRGLLIEGYGEGNVPAGSGAIEAALRRAHAAGVTVLIGSRVIGGKVGQFHYAAGAWIARTGAVETGDMTPVAAFAKLTVLLAAAGHHGWDRATVAALLKRGLAGECTATDRLGPGEVLWPGMRLCAADGRAELLNEAGAGLVLRDGAGKDLWSVGGTGRMMMQDRPAFVAADGADLWQSGASLPGGVLILTGDDRPRLMLHDPAGRQAPQILFGA
ncbi:asparaginase [Paracoccus marinaquae]|uniref:Asparaginase n=1 Tax=Paracoccus marinaquae TaxID=2841926 RepID=A0ABS6AHH9_9RHOB|nr:asparaginase [Paracoccus marinaquae]MBU3029125.1 asparaginase [Paracoccus marinaquae]